MEINMTLNAFVNSGDETLLNSLINQYGLEHILIKMIQYNHDDFKPIINKVLIENPSLTSSLYKYLGEDGLEYTLKYVIQIFKMNPTENEEVLINYIQESRLPLDAVCDINDLLKYMIDTLRSSTFLTMNTFISVMGTISERVDPVSLILPFINYETRELLMTNVYSKWENLLFNSEEGGKVLFNECIPNIIGDIKTLTSAFAENTEDLNEDMLREFGKLICDRMNGFYSLTDTYDTIKNLIRILELLSVPTPHSVAYSDSMNIVCHTIKRRILDMINRDTKDCPFDAQQSLEKLYDFSEMFGDRLTAFRYLINLRKCPLDIDKILMDIPELRATEFDSELRIAKFIESV